MQLLESVGVDFVYQLNFDKKTSEITAESYIKDFLVDGLGVRAMIIGDDFPLVRIDLAIILSWKSTARNIITKFLKLRLMSRMVIESVAHM